MSIGVPRQSWWKDPATPEAVEVTTANTTPVRPDERKSQEPREARAGFSSSKSPSPTGGTEPRKDVPVRRPYARGSRAKAIKIASSLQAQQEAIGVMRGAQFAKSSMGPKASRWRFVRTRFSKHYMTISVSQSYP